MHILSKILMQVIADLVKREETGLKKYGTTVDRKDLSSADWLQHQYEELLDAALYNRAAHQAIVNQENATRELLTGLTKIVNEQVSDSLRTRERIAEMMLKYGIDILHAETKAPK